MSSTSTQPASDTAQATVQIKRLEHGKDLPLPSQATGDAAGFDLRAALDAPLRVAPGTRELVPAGISIALPSGYEAQVRARSGLAVKHGIALVNGPGTIDADYRGELKVILINLGDKPFVIERGDRIAQLVVQKLPVIRFEEVQELDATDRGEGGFGHTGGFDQKGALGQKGQR